MTLIFHKSNNILFGELPATEKIGDIESLLDLMAEARYNDSGILIIHNVSLPDGFFDLKTGTAGEILQKFSNYRMNLSIIGNFSQIESKSLNDFIRESNRRGSIMFVSSVDEAIIRMAERP